MDKDIVLKASELLKLLNFLHGLEYKLDNGESITQGSEDEHNIGTWTSNVHTLLLDNGVVIE